MSDGVRRQLLREFRYCWRIWDRRDFWSWLKDFVRGRCTGTEGGGNE